MDTPLRRILDEGYGPGAWHGPDFKQALADVDPALALWRPAPERHNIAEIALHHAFYLHSARGRITGPGTLEPFAGGADDWAVVPGPDGWEWARVQEMVADMQERLATLVDGLDAGRTAAVLPPPKVFELILGITCHAAYHAGQVQLLRRLYAV